ncbi:MAG: energy transducer TonB [Flavobacteriales bacterium]
MIRRALLLLVTFGALASVSAQGGERTTTIKRKGPAGFKERFEVLRSDTSIRHGDYERSLDGAVIEKGRYAKGIRTGEWLFSDTQGQVIAHGTMIGGTKTGVWHYSTPLGEPVQTVDHTADSLLWFDPEAERRAGFEAPAAWPDTAMQRRPIFKGGMGYMNLLLMHNTRYPTDQLDRDVEGRVMVKFIVDKQGNTTSISCVEQDKPGFCAEAERAVAALGNNWIPGQQSGGPVPVKFQLPVHFKIR